MNKRETIALIFVCSKQISRTENEQEKTELQEIVKKLYQLHVNG